MEGTYVSNDKLSQLTLLPGGKLEAQFTVQGRVMKGVGEYTINGKQGTAKLRAADGTPEAGTAAGREDETTFSVDQLGCLDLSLPVPQPLVVKLCKIKTG